MVRSRGGRGLVRLIAVGAALFSSGCVVRSLAEWKSPTVAGKQWRLPNGLDVIAEEDANAPIVSMALVIGAGAADDPLGKGGLAHLVEHLVFESRPEGRRTISDILDFEADAESKNGMTSQDLTTFVADAPRDSLPLLVGVAQDVVSWPLANVDPAQVPIVVSTVRAELDESTQGDPEVRMDSWAQQTIFPPSHPYGRLVAGTAQSLSALSFDDAVEFTRKHYRANNATLVFTGGVDTDQLARLLSAAFGRAAPAERPPPLRASPSEAPPNPPPISMTRHRAAIQDPELRILWTLPSDYGPGGGNMATFLTYLRFQVERIQREDSNIKWAEVDSIPGAQATTIEVEVTLHDAANVEWTAEFLIDRLTVIAGRSQEAEVAFRAPPRWVGARMILDMANPSSRAMLLARHAQLEGDPLGLLIRHSETTHPDSALLRSWLALLTRERARAMFIEPAPGWGVAGDWLPPVDAPTVRAQDEKLPPLSGIDLLGHLPDLSGATSRVLANGLDVEVVPIRGAPTVSAMLAFPGGESVGPTGAADLLEMWGLNPWADRVGAFDDGALFANAFATDKLSVSLRGQPQNVHRMIDWLGDWVKERRVPDEVWIWASNRVLVPTLRRLEARSEVRGLARHLQALYPGSSWGERATADQIGALDSSSLRHWAKQIISPAGAVLVVTGDFDAAGTLGRIEKAFGEWDGEARPAPPSPEPPAPHAPAVFVNGARDANVAQVLFSCRLPPAKTARQALVSELSATTLGEALNRTWRTETGLVYGVGAAPRVLWGGAAHFSLDVIVSNERLTGILAGLRSAIADKHSALVEPRDFEHAKQEWVRARDEAFLTTQGAAREIARLKLSGGSVPELVSEGVTVADVSLAEVEQALRTCPGTAVLSVTGDETEAEAALANSGWGIPEGGAQ